MTDEFEIAELLEDVFAGGTLSAERARDVMGRLMDGKLSQMQAAALLAALRTRGESVEEIVGFAQAMRQRAVRVPVTVEGPLIDTCGTGGTGLDVINVSTTAMFVAAAAGAKVAKHGNVGVTRRSGSADVLEAAGARLDLSPDEVARAVEEVGLAFVFARNHHPAMRFVAPIRADLRARTIFNNLGPLTNPAGANRQLMGVFAPDLTRLLAEVLKGLGVERALVVHGDGLDDFTVSGPSLVTELRGDGSMVDFELTPEQVGLGRHPLEELAGGDPERNAAALRAVLDGSGPQAAKDVVAFNAGAAIYLADLAEDITAGVDVAREVMASGAAARKLEQYLRFTNQVEAGRRAGA